MSAEILIANGSLSWQGVALCFIVSIIFTGIYHAFEFNFSEANNRHSGAIQNVVSFFYDYGGVNKSPEMLREEAQELSSNGENIKSARRLDEALQKEFLIEQVFGGHYKTLLTYNEIKFCIKSPSPSLYFHYYVTASNLLKVCIPSSSSSEKHPRLIPANNLTADKLIQNSISYCLSYYALGITGLVIFQALIVSMLHDNFHYAHSLLIFFIVALLSCALLAFDQFHQVYIAKKLIKIHQNNNLNKEEQ